jgi:hypothetical protein
MAALNPQTEAAPVDPRAGISALTIVGTSNDAHTINASIDFTIHLSQGVKQQ